MESEKFEGMFGSFDVPDEDWEGWRAVFYWQQYTRGCRLRSVSVGLRLEREAWTWMPAAKWVLVSRLLVVSLGPLFVELEG